MFYLRYFISFVKSIHSDGGADIAEMGFVNKRISVLYGVETVNKHHKL